MISDEKRYSRGLYRSRSGAILGVCRGLAGYFGIAAFWVRLIAVFLLLATGLWPITILYIIAAFVMKPEPYVRVRATEGSGYYDSCRYSSQGVFHGVKRKFKNMDRRIRRMEDIVTNKDYDWESRLNQ